MTYKWIFTILKIEKVKTFLSAVKRIRQRFEIKGTVNMKVRWCRPRAFTIKDNHRLKMTVFEEYKKTFVEHSKKFKTAKRNSLSRLTKSRRVKETIFLSKKCEFFFFCGQKKFSFKTVISSLWSSFIVKALGRHEQTFMFTVPLISNLCLIVFTAERNVFTFSIFKIVKIHL